MDVCLVANHLLHDAVGPHQRANPAPLDLVLIDPDDMEECPEVHPLPRSPRRHTTTHEHGAGGRKACFSLTRCLKVKVPTNVPC